MSKLKTIIAQYTAVYPQALFPITFSLKGHMPFTFTLGGKNFIKWKTLQPNFQVRQTGYRTVVYFS